MSVILSCIQKRLQSIPESPDTCGIHVYQLWAGSGPTQKVKVQVILYFRLLIRIVVELHSVPCVAVPSPAETLFLLPRLLRWSPGFAPHMPWPRQPGSSSPGKTNPEISPAQRKSYRSSLLNAKSATERKISEEKKRGL